ncbi:phytoene desaturase family protein [Pseudomonas sp. Marseille-QA0332]
MARSGAHEVIFIGSGINSLVGAALLAKRGKRVLVLERNEQLGGCIRTEELFPGFTHEVLSSWHPLFVGSAAYGELKADLHVQGVEVLSGDYSTGWVRPDGSGIALNRDLEDVYRRLESLSPGDGLALKNSIGQVLGADGTLTLSLLGNDPYGPGLMKPLYRALRERGIAGLLGYASQSLETFRRWSERTFASSEVRALIAPWALHSGLGPDDACSALIGKLTFASVVSGGMPVIKGGGSKLVDALTRIIESRGGSMRTQVDVQRVLLDGGRRARATGVVITDGTQFSASEAVVCNVTPQQLYDRLLPGTEPALRAHARTYRYGRGCMQIHFALREKPQWLTEELGQVPLVHLTESMEQTCLSVTEANNGLLPSRPTLGIGQPITVDRSQAPDGCWILWIQMQELPTYLRGDAAGKIQTPADGRWTEAVREAFADRVQTRLEGVMPGLTDLVIGRRCYSPADLENLNCNLVGGDPYSGICSPDQFFWLRPFAPSQGAKGNRTPIRSVYHIGAATHPGPGLGAGSGTLIANRLAPR